MTDPMTPDLDALEQAAKAVIAIYSEWGIGLTVAPRKETATYIALANPATILALIAGCRERDGMEHARAMTTDRELREAAMAATKGEWMLFDDEEGQKEYLVVSTPKSVGGCCAWTHNLADARYIALASPSVVLALLDRVEKLEAKASAMDWLMDGAPLKSEERPHD